MRLRVIAAATALAMSAGAAMAEPTTVILDTDTYRDQPGIDDRFSRDPIVRSATGAGYKTMSTANGPGDALRARLTDRYEELLGAERLVFVVRGHIVTDGSESWLLGRFEENDVGLFEIGTQSLRLSALFNVMKDAPEGAVLFVVPSGEARVGKGLRNGVAFDAIPAGVTVIEGDARAMTRYLSRDFFTSGGWDRFEDELYPAALIDVQPSVITPSELDDDRDAFRDAIRAVEDRAWRDAQARDTAEGYRAYLRDYPDGRYADAAEDRLAEVERTPEEIAAAEEADLRLDRDTRRSIQRNLSILGYDTRGIDGIFGQGTRRAVRNWQTSEGLTATGYLTGNQIARLEEDARRRQAELEAEAELRQAEEDRADRAYWRQTGQGANEQALRDYLARYPDGLFSAIARDRLADIEAERQDRVAALDRQDWQAAQSADTVRGYRQYLEQQPNGAFRNAAQERIDALRGNDRDFEAARNEEAQVVANPITRLLVERRLSQLGLDPGTVDGRFDEATRRAIRRYQRARSIDATGYVSQRTLVRMLAGN